MKIKVFEASGKVLDYLVAKCEGHQWRCPWMLRKEGYSAWIGYERAWGNPHPDFSTDWAQGGPIIEREGMGLRYCGFDREPYFVATSEHRYFPKKFGALGPTALIAAMRCFVASKLGDTVDVPQELPQ